MELGAFSVSLAVKDLAASQAFYEALGFHVMAGNAEDNWLIMKHGDHAVGLFQGMFERNMLTFNPGWNQDGNAVTPFTDVRDIQRHLRSQGIEIVTQADENTTGPASIIVRDPDGNPILIDQHV